MNNYGATVKELRKSKGLLLKELVDEQLSMSLLSQFENGKTTISCERFHRLLDKLEVSFAEFQLLHTGEHHSEAQKLMVDYVRSMGIESIDEVPKIKKEISKADHVLSTALLLGAGPLLTTDPFLLLDERGAL